MSTVVEFEELLNTYKLKYRHPDLSPIEVSELYDLFPHYPDSLANVKSSWPNQWPNSDQAGVYLFLNSDKEIIYVGKASMKNTLGSRLNAYCSYGDDEKCKLINRKWVGTPRYVMTIAVAKDMSFEAPALEEFLITRLTTTDNKIGSTSRY